MAHVCDRFSSTTPTTCSHAAARAKSSGRVGGLLGRLGGGDAVDAGTCAAPLGAGDEVPDLVLVDETPRVDQPLGALTGPAGVVEPDLAPPHDGGLQQVDHLRPVAVALAPAGGVDHVAAAAASASAREGLRQGPHQLAQGRLGLARDGGRRTHQQEQRLGLGGRQPAEVGAGPADQLPAAPRPGCG